MSQYSENLIAARTHFEASKPDFESGFKALEPIYGRNGYSTALLGTDKGLLRETLMLLQSAAERAAENGETYPAAMKAAQIWLRLTRQAGQNAQERQWGFAFILRHERRYSAWKHQAGLHFSTIINWLNEAREAGLNVGLARAPFLMRVAIDSYYDRHKDVVAAFKGYQKTMGLAGITDFTKEIAAVKKVIAGLWQKPDVVDGKPYIRIIDITAYARTITQMSAPGSAVHSEALLEMYRAAKTGFAERRNGMISGPRAIMHARRAERMEGPLVLDNIVVSEQIGEGGKDSELFATARRTGGGKSLSFSWAGHADFRRESFEHAVREHIATLPDAGKRREMQRNLAAFLRAVDTADSNWKQKRPAAPDAPNFADYLERNMTRLSAQVAAAAG